MEKVHHFMSLQSIMSLMSGFTPSIFLYVNSVDSVKAVKEDKEEAPAMRKLW